MHRQFSNASPDGDELQPQVSRLAGQVEKHRALLSGDAVQYEQGSAVKSAFASTQESPEVLARHARMAAPHSSRPTPPSGEFGRDQMVATRRQVMEVARSLHAVRAEVQHEALVLSQLKASRSWRFSKTIRFFMELMRRPDLLRHELKHLYRSLTRRAGRVGQPQTGPTALVGPLTPSTTLPHDQALVEVELGLLQLTLPAAEGFTPDVYLWAVIDWHFRFQRPQHLARVLAGRGHRVFYISNEFIDRPYPGFTLEPLDQHGRLYQVHLYLTGRPQIYSGAPAPAQVAQLDSGLTQLASWSGARQTISILHHPYWRNLAPGAPDTRIIYDCLDHQAGFADNSESILAEEHRLLKCADLVVATSQWLKDELGKVNEHVALVRNAGEYEFFSHRPFEVFADPAGRRVIGYYGAIEAWLDVALVRAIAEHFPQCLVLLIGRDVAGAAKALSDLPNVYWNDEVKYTALPFWLHGFDVCLLPFQVLPLTLATNPVKIYEYLSAGKPVVAVDLPEMAQFGDLIRTASTHAEFLDALSETLDGTEEASLVERRQAFAAEQTWEHRVEELEAAMETILARLPRVSVIVVTYGNLKFTRACLDSLQRYSAWADLEVIVVDNSSQDGTPEFLQSWRDQGESRQIILNTDNRGFAAANNQGLAAATGEYLILLNNDTYVTDGWVRGLLSHLRSDDGIGLIGPVTNNIGNEARIQIDYSDMEEMAERSRVYTTLHRGRSFEIPTLAFFCVAMTRATYETIGPLDEDFKIGFFEDDDYCRRIAQAGLRVVCAEDVFIHHHLSASFDQLKQEDRKALFERNKIIYEAKWGAWQPHVYR